MYAAALTPDEQRELAALRARAYGPGADIDADPAALARLRELERLGHDLAIQDAVDAAAPVDDGLARAEPEPADIRTRDAEDDAVSVGPTRAERVRALVRRVSPSAWIVAASAAVVIAAVVWGVSQLTARGSDLSLAPSATDVDAPLLLGDDYLTTLYGVTTEELQAHDPYRAVTPWSWTAGDGTRCLLLTVEGFDRIVDGACTPAGLDPVTHITAWPGFSEQLIGELPQGSVIRFELHDGRVHVWVRAAADRS